MIIKEAGTAEATTKKLETQRSMTVKLTVWKRRNLLRNRINDRSLVEETRLGKLKSQIAVARPSPAMRTRVPTNC